MLSICSPEPAYAEETRTIEVTQEMVDAAYCEALRQGFTPDQAHDRLAAGGFYPSEYPVKCFSI